MRGSFIVALIIIGSFSFAPVFAANANLFVSAENSQFDNYMSGPQVIEVVVIDSDINDTDEAKGEPDVTVNGKILRMVQAVDGNWYGYFADQAMAVLADATTGVVGVGLDFGEICTTIQASNSISEPVDATFFNNASSVAMSASACGNSTFDPTDINVVREAKTANNNVDDIGQIGLSDIDAFPFIQLYALNPTGNVVIQYNKGGGAQTTTLTFDTVDQFAGAELDKSSYGQGDEVHITVTDLWLNIDPTDEDSWTFGTTGLGTTSGASTNYQVFDENGNSVGDVSSNAGVGNALTASLGDLMCKDNCVLLTTTDVQSKGAVITLEDNDDSVLINADGDVPVDGLVDPQNPLDWQTGGANILGAVPVTVTEQGPNSGVFGTYDESDQSNIVITDDAKRGTSASIDYNQTPATIPVEFSFGSIDIQPFDDEWNSGEEIPVQLVDADANLNSRADEDLDFNNPNVAVIPALSTGSPATLAKLTGVTLNAVPITVKEVQVVSDRAILTSASGIIVAAGGGDTLVLTQGTMADFFGASPSNQGTFRGVALFNYDIRSFGDALDYTSVTALNIAGVPIVGFTGGLQGTVLIDNTTTSPGSTLFGGLLATTPLTVTFTLAGPGGAAGPGTEMPIASDVFGFGFIDDGVQASERVSNQIIRLELEETGDNTSTFEGSLEYTMLNQLNILDADTYQVLSTIADDPTFIVIEDLTGGDAPRVTYRDLGADGVTTQVSDQEETPTHSGVVSFDKVSYVVGDIVTVVLQDVDLNVDSDLIDIFTVVDGTLFTDPARDAIGTAGLPEFGFGPLGQLLDITFDNVRWQESETCTVTAGADPGLDASGFNLIETSTESGTFLGEFKIPTNWCRDGETLPESITGLAIGVNYADYRDASGEIIKVTDNAGIASSIIDNVVLIESGSSGSGCQFTDSCLTPSTLMIFTDDMVTWFNLDVAYHAIVSGNSVDGPDGIFDSGFISPGDSFSFVFESAGDFEYYDVIHPWVAGNVIVEELLIPQGTDVVIGRDSHNVNCQDTDDCYLPPSLLIEPGNEVVWFNADLVTHAVTSGNPTDGSDGNFNAQITPGQNFTRTFIEVGTFPYFDIIHPWATGEIIVNQVFPPGVDIAIALGSSIPACEINDNCFIPSSFIADIGDSVTWLNDDIAGHTVTSGSPGGGHDGKFDSGLIFPGGNFTNTFSVDGTFPYYDMIHPWVIGNIIVEPEDCLVPSTGNWTITQNCKLITSATSPANVLVSNNSLLTIPSGVTLTIPSGSNITVESGSGVLVKSTGSLKVLS